MLELSAKNGILFFRESQGGLSQRGATFQHKLSLAQREDDQITKASTQSVSTNNDNNDGNISCSISSGRHRVWGMTIFNKLSSALLVCLPIAAAWYRRFLSFCSFISTFIDTSTVKPILHKLFVGLSQYPKCESSLLDTDTPSKTLVGATGFSSWIC